MKLFVTCKDCEAQLPLPYSALDRAELARTVGDTFSLRCPKCHATNTYTVNEVVARESAAIAALAFGLLLLGTGVLAYCANGNANG